MLVIQGICLRVDLATEAAAAQGMHAIVRAESNPAAHPCWDVQQLANYCDLFGQHEAVQSACVGLIVVALEQVAELSELPFYPDQISLLMRTGVLMGVHGAGLANQVYMKPRSSAVIEVWFNMDNNFHYHNLAHMLGHKYYNVRSDEQLDVAAVAQRLVEAMNVVASVRAESMKRSSWWKRSWMGG